MSPYVLILFYSRHGATQEMAYLMRDALDAIGVESKVRTVPPITTTETIKAPLPQDTLFATKDDLRNCAGLLMGSPTRFGNMAAPLKHFIDSTSDVWLSGGLVDKPAGVFTSSASMHGGQETTLMTMMLPLLHHGAYIVGVPYSEAALNETQSGGTPYGPSHVAGNDNLQSISPEEKQVCSSLAKRIGRLVQALAKS